MRVRRWLFLWSGLVVLGLWALTGCEESNPAGPAEAEMAAGTEVDLVAALDVFDEAEVLDVRASVEGDPQQRSPGQFLKDQLGLTDDQMAQLKAAMNDAREAFQALREQFKNEEITEEEFRTQAREIMAQHRSRMEDILTPEQLEQLRRLQAHRHRRHHPPRLIQLAMHPERAMQFLNHQLGLDDEQASQISEILQRHAGTLQELRTAFEEERITRQELMVQAAETLRALREDIRNLLHEDQQHRFEWLFPLLRGPRHGAPMHDGPGPGTDG